MATDSNNYMSKFKPRSCFFTDPGSIEQSDAQAFGPVLPPSSSDKFRLTTKFTSTGAKAYAPCKGVVLLQPQTGNAQAVNVIIRPYTQPISGLNIKYFIYRGLNKASFFANDEVLPSSDNASDFIKKINESFTSFHQSISPEEGVPIFLAKYIGFDPVNQAGDLQLASFFFKQSNYVDSDGEFVEADETAFELPLVNLGASLGDFIAGECGIDIVLSYGDYSLPEGNDVFSFDLAYARAKETFIDVSSLTDAFQKKVKREQIFQFLDAAAYYGFHCIEGGEVQTNTGNVLVSKKGIDIYTDIVSKFFTKNNVYLYIQSDRTRSYNFYGNYVITEGNAESLKFGITEDALVAREYSTNGWPLIIENRPQVSTDGRNRMYVQFVTDNNVNTMLYGQVGQIDNAQHNNFCGPDDLRLTNSPDTDEIYNTLYSKILVTSNPAVEAESKILNVSTFNILLYQGKTYKYLVQQITDDLNEVVDNYAQPEFFDEVFDLINGLSLFQNEDHLTHILSSQRTKLINHYYNKVQYGVTAVNTVIITDLIDTHVQDDPYLSRVTYLVEAIDLLNKAGTASGTFSSNTKASSSMSIPVASTRTYSLPDPFYYNQQIFSDQDQIIRGLTLRTADGSIPDKIILGLSETENNSLQALITGNFSNTRLFLLKEFEDNNTNKSPEDVEYQRYNVGIVVEDADILKLLMPPDEIVVYSLDRNYYFSKLYSEYMPIVDYSQDYLIVNTVV